MKKNAMVLIFFFSVTFVAGPTWAHFDGYSYTPTPGTYHFKNEEKNSSAGDIAKWGVAGILALATGYGIVKGVSWFTSQPRQQQQPQIPPFPNTSYQGGGQGNYILSSGGQAPPPPSSAAFTIADPF